MTQAMSEQLVVRVTAEQYSELKSRAQTEERSVGQIVRFALRAYLTPSRPA
jgi:hypothetical protein